jgi:hypothetical protein
MESLRCVCGNIATEVMMSFVDDPIAMMICKSCKWMIDHDQHDEPTDKIRKILWEKTL